MDFDQEDDLREETNENQGFASEENANPSSSGQFSDEELLKENETSEENENPLARAGEGIVEDAKAVAQKKILSILLKNPIFWIVIGIGFFLFIAILFLHMDFDLVGVGEVKPKYYQTPSCGRVYLTWENPVYTELHKNDTDYEVITDPNLVDIYDEERFQYEEYTYDDFVAGIIWTDNQNAYDVDNDIVYQAMAIAARSRLIASLPDNCVVLRDYNEQAQSFTKLEGNEEKYSEITEAVRLSQGIIIGRETEIINALYDTFSYTTKRKEEDGRKYFYHMMNENEDSEQVIPAEWVDDLEQEKAIKISKEKVSQTKELESLSLYGAKYLLEKADSQYELYRILEYYYGRDIEYYTISTSFLADGLFGASSCMWWPVGGLFTTTENGILYSKMEPYSTVITSGFGFRISPTAGASSNHESIDIGGKGLDGQINIIAVADGEVIASKSGCVRGDSSCGGGLGNYVKIQHRDGTVTRYGHLYSVSVNIGDQVKQGQVIGLMGSTGTSTGVHLDFQVLVNGTPVNPLNYVSATNTRTICSVPGFTGSGNGRDFITYIASAAVEDMHSSHILASVTIAQAILESNWGKSSLAAQFNNFFGIKAGGSWSGKTVNLPTTECDGNGNCYRTFATWRIYDNALDSIKDHSRLLSTKRYSGVVGERDYTTAIEIIKKGGYATDPNYVSKITNLIRTYNLDQYDKM